MSTVDEKEIVEIEGALKINESNITRGDNEYNYGRYTAHIMKSKIPEFNKYSDNVDEKKEELEKTTKEFENYIEKTFKIKNMGDFNIIHQWVSFTFYNRDLDFSKK